MQATNFKKPVVQKVNVIIRGSKNNKLHRINFLTSTITCLVCLESVHTCMSSIINLFIFTDIKDQFQTKKINSVQILNLKEP